MPVNKDYYTLAGSSGQSTGYNIDNSLRFNDDNSGFLLDAGTGAGDTRKKNTWSLWVKRSNLSSAQYIASYRYDATNYQYLLFKSDDKFEFTDVTGGSVQSKVVTAREFRDPAAWYHIVCVWDTADGVAGNRARVYVNGVRETSLNTGTYPSQNADSGGAGRADARIRIGTYDATGNYFDGYLAEVHYTDNYAYDPPNFGEFKEDTDIWIPKEFEGSYGSAGAYLDFETTGTLGANSKGKGNFSTSGIASHDQRTDSPTNNHATWNLLVNPTPAFANGNIDVAFQPASSTKWAKTAMNFTLPNTGTWYWEGQEFNNVINPATSLGIVDSDSENLADKVVGNRPAENMGTFTGIKVYSGPGQSLATYEWKNGSATSTSGAAILSTSRLGFLWEPENNRFTIYDDGSQYQQFTSIDSANYVFVVGQETGTNLYFRLFVEANDWTQTPTGITSANALNTKNIGS